MSSENRIELRSIDPSIPRASGEIWIDDSQIGDTTNTVFGGSVEIEADRITLPEFSVAFDHSGHDHDGDTNPSPWAPLQEPARDVYGVSPFRPNAVMNSGDLEALRFSLLDALARIERLEKKLENTSFEF